MNAYRSALLDHCLSLPEAVEDHPWGETVVKRGGKVFAFLGTADPSENGSRITLKPDADELPALLALPWVSVAAYVGRYGWITIDVTTPESLELALECVDQSHARLAPKQKRRRPRGPESV